MRTIGQSTTYSKVDGDSAGRKHQRHPKGERVFRKRFEICSRRELSPALNFREKFGEKPLRKEESPREITGQITRGCQEGVYVANKKLSPAPPRRKNGENG